MTPITDRLQPVEQWLTTGAWHDLQLGVMAAKLLAALTEAEPGDDWQQPVAAAHRFLDQVASGIDAVALSGPQSARLFSVLLTLAVEAGQYRHENYVGEAKRFALIQEQLLPAMIGVRTHAIDTLKAYLARPVFASIGE